MADSSVICTKSACQVWTFHGAHSASYQPPVGKIKRRREFWMKAVATTDSFVTERFQFESIKPRRVLKRESLSAHYNHSASIMGVFCLLPHPLYSLPSLGQISTRDSSHLMRHSPFHVHSGNPLVSIMYIHNIVEMKQSHPNPTDDI